MDLFSYFRGLDEGDNEDGIISWMLASRGYFAPSSLVWRAEAESVGWGVTGEWYDPNPTAGTTATGVDAERLN